MGLAVWFLAVCAVESGSAAANAPRRAADHILVKFRTEALADLVGGTGVGLLRTLEKRLGMPAGARLRETVLHRLRRRKRGGGTLALSPWLYLDVPPGATPEEWVERLQAHPLIEVVEPDWGGSGAAVFPNDPSFGDQWYHYNESTTGWVVRADIHTPEAWEITQGSSNIIVAVLDTGCTTSLVEFAGRMLPGYDFINDDDDPADGHGHGTAVAGVLCATGNNSQQVAGVDWNCRVMPLKVLDDTPLMYGLYSQWADAIDWAVDEGAKVINLSAGGESSGNRLRSAITNAIAHGLIFVTITHNDGSSLIRFPGRMPETIAVGATETNDVRCGFSNYGPEIDLVAPGDDIRVLLTNGTVGVSSGTSFSGPMVAGTAALLCSLRPDLDHEAVRTLLNAGADDEVGDADDTPGFDNYYGWGRLNAANSLGLLGTEAAGVEMVESSSVQLTWGATANASNRQPYRVQYAHSLTGGWTTVNSPSNISYQAGVALWQDDGSETVPPPGIATTRFYRILIDVE